MVDVNDTYSTLTTSVSKPKYDMKASLDSRYAIITIIYTV